MRCLGPTGPTAGTAPIPTAESELKQQVANMEAMKKTTQELGDLQDDEWTSMNTTKKKSKTQAERIERNLTGKQEHPSEWKEHGGDDMWDGTQTERKQ